MINKNTIIAIVFRYFYVLRHNLDRIAESFYFPAMELFLFGLTAVYLKNVSGNLPNIVLVLLTGVLFWTIVYRAQFNISVNFLEELWDKNLINLFASPIRTREWIVAVMILGIIKMLITLSFVGVIAYLLYSFNLFIYGFLLFPFLISLLMSGWVIGFLIAGLVARFGLTIQAFAWTMPMLFAPFSALYYPVSTLPFWAQKVALLVPTSYIFEGMREILLTGHLSYDKLFISFALNILYLILSIWFFVFMFNKSKKLGLGRLI